MHTDDSTLEYVLSGLRGSTGARVGICEANAIHEGTESCVAKPDPVEEDPLCSWEVMSRGSLCWCCDVFA